MLLCWFAEILFVISKMTGILYSLLKTDLSITNIQKAFKKIQKAFKRCIQNHQFEQLKSLGVLSTDNKNNKNNKFFFIFAFVYYILVYNTWKYDVLNPK